MSLVRISNRYLDKITWHSVSSCDFALNRHADIWRINISENLPRLDSFSAMINAAETQRANRYLQPRDKNRFIISRAALRVILGKYLNMQPSAVEFETGMNKKPFLKSSPLRYNVSHSGDWIAIAVSGTDTGIDVESVDHSFHYTDIIGEYFSPEEAKFITSDNSCARFFLLWTRKEALTKATAKGLDDDLRFIPALDGEYSVKSDLLKSTANWQVASFELYPDYIAAVASEVEAETLRFWDVDLSKGSL